MRIFDWILAPFLAVMHDLSRQPWFMWLIEHRWHLFFGAAAIAVVLKIAVLVASEPPFAWSDVLYGARYYLVSFVCLYASDAFAGKNPDLNFRDLLAPAGSGLMHGMIGVFAVAYAVLAYLYLAIFVIANDKDDVF
jgi:hypothetical protein